MMSPRRFPALALALCGLVGSVAALLAGFGSAGVNSATPVETRHAASADAGAGSAPVADIAVTNTVAASAWIAAVHALAEGRREPNAPFVVAALPAPSQMPPFESEPAQMPPADTADPVPDDDHPVSLIDILDECVVLEVCVDHYLWALYERTLKQDTNKVHETRKVKVWRKGKQVTVRKRFVRLVDADFTWKDPIAAQRVGMSMMDYVIGGMDPAFKLKLFHTLRAAEKEGLAPGITSAFRDDYRQSIASGQKAAANRSYHGGSLRGGYGYGVAADVVSVKGATRGKRWLSSVELWTWIDANEQQFGIGRPYLHKDPPHVAPLDGEEYASRRGPKTQTAQADVKTPEKQAVEKKPVQQAAAKKPVRQAAAKPKPGKPVRAASAKPKSGKLVRTASTAAVKPAAAPARRTVAAATPRRN